MDWINFAHFVWVNNKMDDKFRIERLSVVECFGETWRWTSNSYNFGC